MSTACKSRLPPLFCIFLKFYIMNAGKGVGKKKPSYTVGGNVNQYSHYGELYGGSLKH